MVIASRTSEVGTVSEAILRRAEACDYSKKDLFAIRLALEEALSNAIHHGNGDDPAKQVTVEYEVTRQQARITVRDQGRGFRPEQLPDPCCDEKLTDPNGRGVLLMKAYMDEVTFNRQGNGVTLVKRPGPADAAQPGEGAEQSG
jgi:serine/threonine-protein kinase RsbW